MWTHQDHYVKENSEMNIATVDMTDPDTLLDDNLRLTFWSLLGALSWLLQTRADLSPYIGHLQRIAKAPTCRHALLANKVLRYARRIPAGMLFKSLQPPYNIIAIGDSAYKADEGAE